MVFMAPMTRSLILLLGILSIAGTGQAFELSTHAALTLNGVNQSVLNSQALQDQLGLTPLIMAGDKPLSQVESYTQTETPFGIKFIDAAGATSYLRLPSKKFEGQMIADLTNDKVLFSTTGWVMGGAVREDDGAGYPFSAHGEPTAAPEADPFGLINRFCNHFYDPYHRTPLSDGVLPCLQNGLSGAPPLANPDWAMGDTDAFASPASANSSRRNHFSVHDFYESMWRATTGTIFPALTPVVPPDGETPESMRKAYWATTFLSLGHVLHLNEDMAQPQHTRNETHGGGPAGHKSQFENYVERVVLGTTPVGPKAIAKFVLDETSSPMAVATPPPLVFSGYPVPSFSRLSDFWSSGTGETSHFGFGMADYSNHGFFTPANNYGRTRQPYPESVAEKYTWSKLIIKNAGQENEVYAQYLTGPVHDNLTNSDSPVLKRTRYSVFSPIAYYDGLQPQVGYMIDTAIYADDASELIKRAAAYAAGITNHLFRGQLTIGTPAQGAYAVADQLTGTGFKNVRLTVKNTTSDILPPYGTAVPQDMNHGTLMLVVKFNRNNCYQSDITGEYGSPGKTVPSCRNSQEEIVTSNMDYSSGALSDVSLAAGAEAREFTFVLANPLPLSATDVRLQVVFRGQVGADSDVVAVGTKDVPEPTFYTTFNPTDSLLCINGSWYKRNADGTMPSALINAGYNIAPQPLSHFALSFRQNPTKPYATPGGTFAQPLQYPIATVDNLPPGHFIRLAVIAEAGAPWTWQADGYEGLDSPPWDAAVNGVLYWPGTPGVDGKITTTAVPMTTWQGVNTYRFGFVYAWGGTDPCNTQEPRDMVSADGKTFPDRIQDAATILDTN